MITDQWEHNLEDVLQYYSSGLCKDKMGLCVNTVLYLQIQTKIFKAQLWTDGSNL